MQILSRSERWGDQPDCARKGSAGGLRAIAFAIGLLAGCSQTTQTPESIPQSNGSSAQSAKSDNQPVVGPQNAKRALFGDLHVHSSWSFDAFALGVQTTPEDTYRYARGEAIPHVGGGTIALRGPALDFLAVTEHSEYMGVTATLNDENSNFRDVPIIQDLLSEDRALASSAITRFATSLQGENIIQALNHPDIARPTWQRLIDLANEYNEAGVFTTLIGYEYTSMPAGQNLHRNIYVRGEQVPDVPFTSFDSPNPEALWRWMDEQRDAGIDLLSVPHNGNASNGLMYPLTNYDGSPMTVALASARARNEPLSEVFQIKGQSEVHPNLSPNDPFAGFEQFDRVLGRMQENSQPFGSFAREALKQGLVLEASLGVNPYEFGLIGSSDGHNSSSPVDEADYSGKIGIADGTPQARLRDGIGRMDADIVSRWGAAGLVGVWATANTREHVFDALRRRETFATSGPRMSVQLFAGWDFSAADLPQMAVTGYERGVPMGQVLHVPDTPEALPNFLLAASQDPNGAALERLQIVKGWVSEGTAYEQVFDLACAQHTPTGECRALPAPKRCASTAKGATQLQVHWEDPQFDPSQRAFYYARVIEVPTCRWSTYDAAKLDQPIPAHVPRTLQERAVSSPIWIKPLAKQASAAH